MMVVVGNGITHFIIRLNPIFVSCRVSLAVCVCDGDSGEICVWERLPLGRHYTIAFYNTQKHKHCAIRDYKYHAVYVCGH